MKPVPNTDSIGAEIRARADAVMRDRYRGCLLGGAVGDALGASVEFLSRARIIDRFGEPGIRDYVPAYGRLGAITDDTQMTLFTAEGVLRSHVRWHLKGICHPPSVIAYAYLRWLHTQGESHALHAHGLDGWLLSVKELHSQRAPGNTCLSALRSLHSVGEHAHNSSKGCGGVMRVAPVGMCYAGPFQEPSDDAGLNNAFDLAADAAGVTHGHVTGKLTAGVLAVVVALVLSGESLSHAVERALRLLELREGHPETYNAVARACALAATRPNDPAALAMLGQGWVAEEALAISVYAALSAADFESGVILAVNHDGDSDSTGAITGNILGAMHGVSAIPERWLRDLEIWDAIEQVADDLASMYEWKLDDDDDDAERGYLCSRYPGW